MGLVSVFKGIGKGVVKVGKGIAGGVDAVDDALDHPAAFSAPSGSGLTSVLALIF